MTELLTKVVDALAFLGSDTGGLSRKWQDIKAEMERWEKAADEIMTMTLMNLPVVDMDQWRSWQDELERKGFFDERLDDEKVHG